ncbi:MAG: hypothetical protein CM15mP85_11120 [Rhodobacterales bacterium]|nr:MAG: hypothetical protein CM15mP85_11120 [Rhodobacterales bacterium]
MKLDLLGGKGAPMAHNLEKAGFESGFDTQEKRIY